jgi:capping protein beta
MAENDQLTSALNLMRRMPPSSVENSLAGLIELVPDLTEELLNHVDQPLKVQMDSKAQRQFILCDYNRDGDSYRYRFESALSSIPLPLASSRPPSPPSISCCSSPWSNSYFPPSDDGFVPTAGLRKMEQEANDIFDTYRKLYVCLSV